MSSRNACSPPPPVTLISHRLHWQLGVVRRFRHNTLTDLTPVWMQREAPMRTRHHTRWIRCLPVVTALMSLSAIAAQNPNEPDRSRPMPHRVFADSHFLIDDILRRPYDPDVPMGCVGDCVWASSPQGWAFRDDVHWLYLTNLKAFDLEVRDVHGLVQPEKAEYFPSHVHLEGVLRG